MVILFDRRIIRENDDLGFHFRLCKELTSQANLANERAIPQIGLISVKLPFEQKNVGPKSK